MTADVLTILLIYQILLHNPDENSQADEQRLTEVSCAFEQHVIDVAIDQRHKQDCTQGACVHEAVYSNKVKTQLRYVFNTFLRKSFMIIVTEK